MIRHALGRPGCGGTSCFGVFRLGGGSRGDFSLAESENWALTGRKRKDRRMERERGMERWTQQWS